jgi:hypothetical protein
VGEGKRLVMRAYHCSPNLAQRLKVFDFQFQTVLASPYFHIVLARKIRKMTPVVGDMAGKVLDPEVCAVVRRKGQ